MSLELPKKFIERLKTQYPNDYQAMLEAIAQEPKTSIRLNPEKLLPVQSDWKAIPWCPYGYILPERPKFNLDPNFHNGRYYVQESSSMFIYSVLDYLKKDYSFDKVLDMCAAPGGKSTILLDTIEDNQYLVSNEILPKRVEVLRENITKWGKPNVLISQNAPKNIGEFDKYFDLILVDAPCSGEGLFRKDKNAIAEWSDKNLKKCVKRQKEILENAWKALKNGGILIYSTCTYNPDENEKMVQQLLDAHPEARSVSIPINDNTGITVIEYKDTKGYAFLPNKVPGEGFFCSVVIKGKLSESIKTEPNESYFNPLVKEWISSEYYEFCSTFRYKNTFQLASNQLLDELPKLQEKLYIKQVGIDVSEIKDESVEPTHGLAMLAHRQSSISYVNVNYEQALDFLAKNELKLSLEEGYNLVVYEDYALGWVEKKKGNEINHYPNKLKLNLSRN